MAKAPKKKVPLNTVEFDEGVLREIAEATQKEGFMYVEPAKVGQHVKAGFVQLNPEMTDAEGRVDARATKEGLEHINSITSNNFINDNKETTEMTTDSAFVIDADVPLPKRATGRPTRGKTYPFAKMEVEQSIHFPATAAKPEPHRSYASLVSVANSMFAKDTGEFETVEVNVYATDAKGKRLRNPDGSYIKQGRSEVERPVKTYSRRFSIFPVGEDDPRGKGARLYRVA